MSGAVSCACSSSLGRSRRPAAAEVGFRILMILALAALVGEAGCGGPDRSLESSRKVERRLAELARANRLIVERIREGRAERLEETRDAATISRAVRFARRYPDRWRQSSGIFGDY